MVHRVLDFLHWLTLYEQYDRKLTVGVALQGLAGLQLQEAFRLTCENVDWATQTIIVDGEVKNRFRIRRIPVANVVLTLLEREYSSTEPLPSDRIISCFQQWLSYSKIVSKALEEWNDGERPIKPKDLRNTIQTEAADRNWNFHSLQRYVGHSPTTVSGRNYYGDDPSRLVEVFRTNIIQPLEELINEWSIPEGGSILFPEEEQRVIVLDA